MARIESLVSKDGAESDAANQVLVDTSAEAVERYVPSLPVMAGNAHSVVTRNSIYAAQRGARS